MIVITNTNDNTSLELKLTNGLEETHELELSQLPVLCSDQPLVKYQYGRSSWSMSNIVLSQWSSANVATDYQWLVKLTKVTPEAMSPPILKVVYGDTVIDRCVLSQLKVSKTEHLSGTLSLAVLDMTFTASPVEKPPQKVPVDSKTGDSTIKLTQAEQTNYVAKVKEKLAKDKPLATKLGYKLTSKVEVSDVGSVSIDGKAKTTLAELGLVKDKHKPTETAKPVDKKPITTTTTQTKK